jgi:hypothetical protein
MGKDEFFMCHVEDEMFHFEDESVKHDECP